MQIKKIKFLYKEKELRKRQLHHLKEMCLGKRTHYLMYEFGIKNQVMYYIKMEPKNTWLHHKNGYLAFQGKLNCQKASGTSMIIFLSCEKSRVLLNKKQNYQQLCLICKSFSKKRSQRHAMAPKLLTKIKRYE